MNSVSRNIIASSILSLAAVVPLFLSGCDNDGKDEDLEACTCEYQGEVYDMGESFAAADGCNTCVCAEDGSVVCTLIACPEATCSYRGATYAVGQYFPAGDGCNTCSCAADGSVSCTEAACVDCAYQGAWYAEGQSFPAGDGCNTCVCASNGSVVCTENVCCDAAAEPGRTYLYDDPETCATVTFSCPAPTRRFDSDCGCGCEDKTAIP